MLKPSRIILHALQAGSVHLSKSQGDNKDQQCGMKVGNEKRQLASKARLPSKLTQLLRAMRPPLLISRVHTRPLDLVLGSQTQASKYS